MTARAKWKVAAYLTAIFAAGLVSGWVVAGRQAQTNPRLPHSPGPGSSGPRGGKPSIYQMELDATQKSRIDDIMKKYGKIWDDRRQQMGMEMRKDSSNRNSEINALLSPEQREQWEKLRKERDANWRSNSGRGGSNTFDKGEHSTPRNRSKRGEGSNPDNSRNVTNIPGSRSTTPAAPER